MKIEYSKNVDALYIRLREAQVNDSIDIEEGVTVDLDEKGHIVGIEILDASEKLEITDLVNISIDCSFVSIVPCPSSIFPRLPADTSAQAGPSLFLR